MTDQPLAPGAKQRQDLVDAGFTATEVDTWQKEQTQQLLGAGFTPKEVDEHFGVPGPLDTGPMAATINGHLDNVGVDDHARVATSWTDFFQAGLQHSSTGLITGKPTIAAPPDAGFAQKLVEQVGGMVGDAPAIAIGIVTGGALGGAAGTAVPGPGTVAGAVFGAGAGASALPAAIREILTGYYNNPDGPKDWPSFLSEFATTQWNIAKAAVTGGTAASAGGAVGEVATGVAAPLIGATGSKLVGGVANAVTFAGTATATNAALTGQVPNAEDFMAGAILALGFTAAGAVVGNGGRFVPSARGKQVADNLQQIYAKTGIPPREIVQAARGDVVLQGEILGPTRADGTSATPTLDTIKPQEPPTAFPRKPDITATNIDKVMEPPKPTEGTAKAEPVDPVHLDIQEKMPGYLNIFRKLEGSGDREVSPAGAIGRYQIMPGTARQYGFDPAKLTDPAYNEKVATAVLADLHQRYKGDVAAMAVAYNAGPGRADIWLRSGRNMAMLPRETQQYLERASAMGALKEDYNWHAAQQQTAATTGDTGDWVPPPSGHSVDRAANVEGTFKSSPMFDSPANPAKVGTDRMYLTDQDELVNAMLEKIAPAKGQRPAYLDPDKIVGMFEFQLSPARKLDAILGMDKEKVTTEDMMRSTLASRERAGYFVRYGTIDPITLEQTSQASFIKAFEAVKNKGGTVDEFTAYRLASRTVEKAAQGVDTGFPLDKAKALLAKPGMKAKYAEGSKIVRAVKDASIDYAVGSGRFTPEYADALKALNQEHIVMRRVMEPGYAPPNPRRVFGWQRGLKKMEGSQADIVDPLVADIDNLHTIIAIADFNRAVGHIINQVEKVQAENARAEARGEQMKAFVPFEKVSGETSARSEIREGDVLDEYGNPITGDALKAAELFVATKKAWAQVSGNPDEFIYYRNGKFEVWKAKDPNLAKMMRMTWPAPVNPFVDASIRVAGLVRAGVTSAFDFPARNLFQAQLGAAVLAEKSTFPFSDFMHGALDMIKGSDKYREFERMGGAGTAITDLDVNYIKKDIHKIFEGTGTAYAVTNALRHPVDALRTISHMLDASARVGMFGRLKAQGVDPMKAAMMSRKGYIDYGEGFSSQGTQTWSRMAAFMAAGWKDIQQIGQRVAAEPGRVAAIGAAVLTMPTIVNYMLNWMADQELPDGQKYQDLPRWMRDQYWVTPPIFGVRLKLKRPYAVAVPFAMLPERFMDWAATNDPHFGEWVNDALTMIVPPFIPNIIVPAVENWGNRSISTGNALVPASLEAASGYMQYRPDTSETAKAVTKLLGPAAWNVADWSPIVVDNYIREWGGTMPTALLRILEGPFKDPGRPKGLADWPFLGSFFVRNPVGGQQVDDFYSKYDEVTKAHADLKTAIDRQDLSEIKDAATAQAVVKMGGVTLALSNMRKGVNAINLSKDLTDDEKIKRTDQIAFGMVQTAKAGSTILDTLSRRP